MDRGAAILDWAFGRVNGIKPEGWAFRALPSISEILLHLVYRWTIATKRTGTFSIERYMMVARLDKIAQIHDIKVAIHDH